MSPRDARIVLVTAPDLKTARSLAMAALQARLVACANLVPRVESHFWWQGKLDSSREVLILFKTSISNLKRLERVVMKGHPYDTAEFVALDVKACAKKYLSWWLASVK